MLRSAANTDRPIVHLQVHEMNCGIGTESVHFDVAWFVTAQQTVATLVALLARTSGHWLTADLTCGPPGYQVPNQRNKGREGQ